MSTHRSRRIGRRTAERLLRGASRRARATGPDRLGDLLAAAAAPARHSELTGEQAAVAAFRSAHLATAPQPGRRSMLKIALAKLLTAKIAAAASAVAVGGIAVAAAAGTLPGQHGNDEKIPAGTRVVDTSTTSPSTTSGKPDTDKNGQHKSDKSDNPSPSPSLTGLCQAYTAHTASGNDKPHDNPAFSALATAAGGPEKVPAFCTDLLAGKDEGKGKPDNKPTHSKR